MSDYRYEHVGVPSRRPIDFVIRPRRHFQIRTLRSRHFAIKLSKWWRRSERRTARTALAVLEAEHDALSADVKKAISRELLFGECVDMPVEDRPA